MSHRFTPWAECYICGEEWPQDEMVHHIILKQLVDKYCDDQMGFSDVKALVDIHVEDPDASERPIADQGYVDPEFDRGAGEGGAGWGPAGGDSIP